MRQHLRSRIRLDAPVEPVRITQRPPGVREPLVVRTGAAQVRAHVAGLPEQGERRLQLGGRRVRSAGAVEVPVAARERTGGRRGLLCPVLPTRHRAEVPVAARVLGGRGLGDERVEVLPRHDDLAARDEVVLERERPADVRERPARRVVTREEHDRAVVLELCVRRARVRRAVQRPAVEHVVAHAEAVERGRVRRPEVDATEVAVPVDQQDVLRNRRILDPHEVRDRVGLAAAGDLEEALVVPGRSGRHRQVDVERRAARSRRRERRRRRDADGRVADDLADIERVARRPAAAHACRSP